MTQVLGFNFAFVQDSFINSREINSFQNYVAGMGKEQSAGFGRNANNLLLVYLLKC